MQTGAHLAIQVAARQACSVISHNNTWVGLFEIFHRTAVRHILSILRGAYWSSEFCSLCVQIGWLAAGMKIGSGVSQSWHVPTFLTIWVEHGNDFDHVCGAQPASTFTVAGQVVYAPLHNPGCVRFTRMHPRSQHYTGFFCSPGCPAWVLCLALRNFR